MVNKLTDTVKPLDEINKINEIIDELDNVDALPSQTGNAGKFLTTDGTDASWGIPTSRNIGEIVQSSLPLIDAGLHLLDGALLSGDGIYGEFVDYIANNYTVPSTAFTSESAWQSSVTNYGSCGKFVYDSTLNTVRLPKVSDILQGTTDANALGDLVEAGLPNITGTVQTAPGRSSYTMTGAMYQYATSNATNVYGNGATSTNTQYGIGFDASRSSSIYGNSSTVQPQTIKVLTYIVIATSAKTDIEVDIDNVVTDLNGKVNKSGDTMSGTLRIQNGNSLQVGATDGNYFRVDATHITFHNVNDNDYTGLICTNSAGGSYFFGTKNSSSWTTGIMIKPSTKEIWFSDINSVSGAVAEIKCVTQTYVNGASWYRVWSDGWIEQGGGISTAVNTTDSAWSVTFLKTFSNTNYTVQTSVFGGWAAHNIANVEDKYTNKMSGYASSSGNSTKTIYWYACGY